MNKSKKIFIITLTFLMLVGLTTIAATDIDNNDTTTITQTSQVNTVETTTTKITQTNTKNYDTANTKEASTSQTDNIQETSNSEEKINNKNGEKTQNLKASRSYDVTTFNQLNNYLTSSSYDTVTLNINSNINLTDNITVNNAIKTLTINGNNKIINGQNRYQFLKLTNDINIKLNYITINNCYSEGGSSVIHGRSRNSTGPLTYSLVNINISNSKFNNNYGISDTWDGGTIKVNNGTINVNNCEFNNNKAINSSGGAISAPHVIINNSIFSNNFAEEDGGAIVASTIIVNRSIFRNNSANYDGGALDISTSAEIYDSLFVDNVAGGSNVNPGGGAINANNLTVFNSNFTNNKCNNGEGGAISSRTILNVNNCIFINNSAYTGGGAIFAFALFERDNSTFPDTITIKNSKFINNSLDWNDATSYWTSRGGGAIGIWYWYGGKTIIDNCNFTQNSINSGEGGAIRIFTYHIEDSYNNITNCNFLNNTAINGSYGAISYSTGGSSSDYNNINNCNFTGNTAKYNGGVIGTDKLFRTSNSDIKIHEINITNSKFNDNHAVFGGGVIYGINNTTAIINNSIFSNNTANQGGILCLLNGNVTIINSKLNDSNALEGGVIYGRNSTITITQSNITNNNATIGGAINGLSNDTITITGTNLTNNNATSGGAINGYNITITNSTLTNNNATIGGAIYAYTNSTITITGTNLTNNNATSGGAIYANTNSNITINYSNFNDNAITQDGGAIYANTNSNITINYSNFNDNKAKDDGGAIYANTNSNITINYSNFTNNNASYWGGAICTSSNTVLNISNSNFTKNYATRGGGVIYEGSNANLTVQSSNFKDNYVTSTSEYVVTFNNADNVKITDSTFTNNTDNKRDMLFSEAKTGASVDIHGNNYIDNYLATNITKLGNVNVTVLDDVTYNYTVNVTVRSIYNHTINNGTVYVKSDRISNSYTVRNNQTNITIRNRDLELPVNVINYNYTSLSKHYQNAYSDFNISKSIPTYLSLSLNPSDNVNVSGTVHVVVSLVDVDNNRLRGHEIAVYINGIKYTENVTNATGEISFDYVVPGYTVNNVQGLLTFEAEHIEEHNTYYNSSVNVDKSIRINQIATHIHIDYDKDDAREGNTFNVTIKLCEDETSHRIIAGQTVYYNITSIDGETLIRNSFFRSASNGNNITINNLPEEGVIVNAWFDGSTQYIGYLESEQIIPGYNSTQTIVNVPRNTYINKSEEITIRLLDSNENPLPDESVVWIKINNQSPYAVAIIGGEYKFNYTSPISGYVNITATFDKTSIYSGSSGRGGYNVLPLPTHTTLVVESSKVENTTITAYINDTIHDKTVNGGTINITENGVLLQTVNVENGKAVFTLTGLTAKDHTLRASYSGVTGVYGISHQNTGFKVEKTDTVTNIEPITVLVTDTQVTINVTVTDENNNPVTTGTVNITVETQPAINNIAITSGIAQIYINNLPAGTYNINATYNGDETYNPSNKQTTLTVNKIPTTTEMEILDNTLGNVTLKVTVTNKTGEKVAQGTISILNEYGQEIPTLIEKPLNNGEAIITLPFTSSDDLKLKIRYNENNIYNESYALNQTGGNTINIRVNKIPTITTADILNNTLGNVTLKVTVTNKTGEKVNQGTITVLNNYNMPITGLNNIPLINGEATIKVPSQTAGENLLLTVHYNENDVYNASNAENKSLSVDDPKYDKIDIIVNKIPTITTADILNNTLGNVTIHITVTNSTGDKVIKGTITVLNSYNNPITGLEEVTLENGETTIKVPSQTAGENLLLTIQYNENDVYNSSKAVNTSLSVEDPKHDIIDIIVNKIPTITTADILNNTLGNVTLKVTVTNSTGDKVSKGTITVFNSYNMPITGLDNIELSDGETTIKVPSQTAGENLLLTIQYNENDIYNSSKAENTSLDVGDPNREKINITVNKIPTITTADILNNTLGNVTIHVTVTNSTGDKVTKGNVTIRNVLVSEGIPSGEITLHPGDVIYDLDEIELTNGEAVIKIPAQKAGESIYFVVCYNENDIYDSSTAFNDSQGKPLTITVQPHDSVLKVDVTPDNKVNVNLTDDAGDAIPNAPITITDENGNKIGEGTTDENGTTTIPVTLPVGPHNITVSYPGDDNHKPVNETVPVTVSKHNTVLDATPDNGSVIVITSNENGTPIPNLPITITDKDGNTVGTGTTGTDGTVTIPVDLLPGNYNITVSTPGDENNSDASKTIPITIPLKDAHMDVTLNETTPSVLVNLTDDDGKPISGAPINITDKDGNTVGTGTTGTDGTVTIPVSIPSGDNNLTVSYPGNDIYKPVTENIPIVENKIPTNTTVDILDTTLGNVTLKVTVTNNTGDKVTMGTITVYDKDKNPISGLKDVALDNGEVSIHIPSQYVGENILVTVHYNENYVYLASNAENTSLSVDNPNRDKVNITVTKIPTMTSVEVLDTTLGNVTLKVTVTNKTDDKVTMGDITVFNEYNLPITGLEKINLADGTVTIKIPSQQGNENIIVIVQYNENDLYNSSKAENTSLDVGDPNREKINITVTKIPTITTVDILNNTLGNVTLHVTVTNRTGDKVNQGTITVLNNYDIPITGLDQVVLENGETTIQIPSQTAGENLLLTIQYNENDVYNASKAVNTSLSVDDPKHDKIDIIVNKIPTKTTADILNNTLGNVTIHVTVTNSTGDKVTKGTITVLNNYNMPITGLNNITLINGEATILIPSQTAGENLLLTIYYNENDVYNSSKAENKSLSVDDPKHDKIDIIVNKIPTKTTADILNNTLGNVTIHVTVTNSTGDKVIKGTVTVLNSYNNPITGLDQILLENGETTITIPSSQAGENITIAVRYNENDIYNSSIATNDSQGNPLTITVQPHDSELTANVINSTTPTVKVNLTDDAGDAIPNAPIIITDENGTVITNGTTGPDGTTTIPVPLPTGDHNITVSYPGDNNHKPTNKTVPVTVEKHNTTLNVTPENGTVKVNASNENGTPIPNLPINITDENGTVIANGTTNENGTVIIPVPLEPGDHNITIITPGDKNNTGTNTTIPITIPPKDTNMTIDVTNGSNPIVKVNLTDDEGKPMPNAPITITDENGTEIANGTTDENGTATIPVPLPTGENNITVSYPGNTTYKPQEETVTVNATPKESKTTGTITNNTVGNVTIDVQVVDPETGKPLTGPVKIIIDGDVAGNGTLNDEGKTTIPVDIDKKGNYTIVVEYEGNDDYNGSNDTLDDVYIKGTDVDMNVIIDNPVVGETEVIITMIDPETGKSIPNAPITITDENGTIIANGTTDENGTTTIPVDLPSGDNNITISYTGDKTHEDKEEKITIRVKSYSVVTVEPVEGIVLDNVTFTAKVRDYQDKPVTGGYVQFSVGGRTLKDENGKNIRVLVENGVAKLSYKAESGWIIDTHPDLTVQAVYTGTSIVLANRSDASKVSIYKRNATVQVSAPDDYVNGTLHIDAVVKDQNGSLINDGVLVFKLNGLSLKDANNKGIVAKVVNGRVHLDVKLPFAYNAKTYNLTATYSNKIYNKATGMNTTSLKAIPTYINATVTIKDEFSKPVITGQIYNKFNNAILEGTAVINIKFDGISYAKKVVINNGTFSETLEGIPIYKPGTHKIEIAAGANSHYEAARQTITSKATPKYNVNPVITSITRNKTSTRVQATIVDTKNNNVQKDLRITIKVNGLSFLVNQTVRNGKVDVLVDTSTLKNRTYNLELVSGANTYYNAGKTTAELPKY